MNHKNDNQSETTLVTICSLVDPIEAELVRNTLLDHEIPSELDGEHQAGFTGTLQIGILVRDSDVENAREILKIHHRHLFGASDPSNK